MKLLEVVGVEENMNDNELKQNAIDEYVKLQMLRASDDIKKALDYQIAVQRAKLQSLGIHTEDLDLK